MFFLSQNLVIIWQPVSSDKPLLVSHSLINPLFLTQTETVLIKF